MPRTRPARTRVVALLAAGAALTVGGLLGLGPLQATASSHREAPLISSQPQYDNTDVYAFVSPDKPDTTTLVANFWPFEEPAGGPNFYKFGKDAYYEIAIDNSGDGQRDLAYRFKFKDTTRNGDTFLYNSGPVTSLDDKDLNFFQTYDLDLLSYTNGQPTGTKRLLNDARVAPSNVGKASMPNYQTLRDQAIKSTSGGLQAYAGQADDPFALDLRVFDLLYGGNLSEVGNDTLKGYNVQTVALQVPTSAITKKGQPIIGVHSVVKRRNAAGEYVQVSRLGHCLVNEVVIPVKDKDKFNSVNPWFDADFAKYVTDPELPMLLKAIYKLDVPPAPRNDLVSVFLTGVKGLNQPPNVRPAELLRLNTSIPPSKSPKRLGVLDGDKAGYPNGRRLTDDCIDISLQVVAGELVGKKNDLGDGVDANDRPFGQTFPYVALPTSGSSVQGNVQGASSGAKQSGSDDKSTPLNADNAAAGSPSGDSRVGPMVAVALGAALLTSGLTAGLLFWFRRLKVGSD